jgi:hypothetical protein
MGRKASTIVHLDASVGYLLMDVDRQADSISEAFLLLG